MAEERELKILHLDTGREWRGGQNQVLTLCQGLATHGIPQILVAPPASPLAERVAEAGIQTHCMKMRGELDFMAPRKLKKIIEENQITIVHTHDAHAHALAWRATRDLPDVTLVVSRRVDFSIRKSLFSRRKYLDPRVRYLAISNGVKDVLIEGGVQPENIQIVPSGVDTSRFTFDVPREKMRKEFNIPNDTPTIGTIGSLVDHKDHATLIDAVPTVLEQHPTALFFIVGDGELRPSLENKIATKGLQNSVILTGHRTDIETFLSSLDLFVVSSHLEGLCTSLIDAMLFALPVVATNTGGIPDLAIDNKTGILIEPKQPEALGKAIAHLLANPALGKRLGQEAKAHATRHFTAHSLISKTLKAYNNLLS